MPIIEAHLLEGYTSEEKQRLAKGLTDAALMVIPAAPDVITVMIHEMPRANYMRGGSARTPAPARANPTQIIATYLTAMEARELEAAQKMLGEGFVMNFPDAPGLTTLAELIAWAKPRYKFVKKTYDKFEAFQNGPVSIVYSIGTLYGEWLDGSEFSGIRFIDRFEITDGKITRQDVWNDMAEVKGKRA